MTPVKVGSVRQDWMGEEEWRIETAYEGVFDRIHRASEPERAYLLWRLLSDWCVGCGKPSGTCDDEIRGCCCGEPKRTVLARQCPACELLDMESVRPIAAVSIRDEGE